MEALDTFLTRANAVLWHDAVLFILLGIGTLFTIWSGFSQYRALTHGVAAVRGRYDEKDDPGAITHFQALSAALSATVGLGNIGGVAIAIALGGPGAVFWMWVVGFIGMALKTTEVTMALLHRNLDDPANPSGGPMWVAGRGLAKMHPSLAKLGGAIAIIFCITLLISTATSGNMFQAWNVGVLTEGYFGVPSQATGIVLAVLVGLVIIGGIQRIGSVAGRLVPIMCLLYLLSAGYVLVVRAGDLPGVFKLILTSAFSPAEAQGAFVGGTAAMAFMFGMKRAFFSNEAGLGSAPIAHSAARTKEPVREGIVAGLEPFIDTIVVCTLTALVILASGAWNRDAQAIFAEAPELVEAAPGKWTLETGPIPGKTREEQRISGSWQPGESVFVVVQTLMNGEGSLTRLSGKVFLTYDDELNVSWGSVASDAAPSLRDPGIYANYPGAMLAGYSFDRVLPGLGRYILPLVVWLFAISTMITWSYYGEQAVVYIAGKRCVLPYRILYCLLIIVACSGWITTNTQLDNLTGFGTGVMLFANIPIMLIFGKQAMRAYKDYIRRLDAGEMKAGKAAAMIELVHGEGGGKK